MASRKAIAAAILKQLVSGGQFVNYGRRDRAPEQAAAPGQPGLFLLKPVEHYRYVSGNERGVPPVREFEFIAVVYTDVGADETQVPADLIDDLLDAIDTAMSTGLDPASGRQTLGGLVYDCRIEGQVECAPGDLQGKGSTAVYLRAVLNSYP